MAPAASTALLPKEGVLKRTLSVLTIGVIERKADAPSYFIFPVRASLCLASETYIDFLSILRTPGNNLHDLVRPVFSSAFRRRALSSEFLSLLPNS